MTQIDKKTLEQILAEAQEKKKQANLALQKEQRSWTENTGPAPTVVPVQYQPDNTPFEYKEGMSVLDIINQGKQKKQQIGDQKERAQKAAKIAALGDFFASLGGLAGGGYANVKEYQPSPYLTKAFAEIDRLRNEEDQADMYYNELARKTRDQDYNSKLKEFLQSKDKVDRYGFQAAQTNATAANRANLEAYKQQGTKVTQTVEDPTKWRAEQALRAQQIAIQQQNADANQLRADKYQSGSTKKDKPEDETILTVEREGKKIVLKKSQAEMMIKRAKEEMKGVTPITKEEIELMDALRKADVNKEQLAKAARLLQKYRPNDYEVYFKPEDITTPPAPSKPKGSFLPQKKRNLLD